jgi:hypothetical protein
MNFQGSGIADNHILIISAKMPVLMGFEEIRVHPTSRLAGRSCFSLKTQNQFKLTCRSGGSAAARPYH